MASNPQYSPAVGRDGDLTLKIGNVHQVWNTDGFTVTEEVELHEVTGYADGYWRKHMPGMKGWMADIECVGSSSENTPMVGEDATFLGTYETGITATGTCWIQSVTTNHAKKGEYRFTVHVVGEGTLTKANLPTSTYEEAA